MKLQLLEKRFDWNGNRYTIFKYDTTFKSDCSIYPSTGISYTRNFWKKLYQIPLNEVLYFETVDKKTFMYTQHKIFECKKTLSAIEQDLIRSNVVRISKTALLNISCLVCVKPYPNHRLLAELNNEENLIVSRKYIPILRDKIRSGYYE